MQEYNCRNSNKREPGFIYSGEEKFIAGQLLDMDGGAIELSDNVTMQLIIRNMNGVVFVEYSTRPIEKQIPLEVVGNAFRARLGAETTSRMRGLYIVEMRLSTDNDTSIWVSSTFEVKDNFIKRMRNR